jgi:TolB-like protein
LPDVFLSYSRDDLPTARRFAEGFEREGLSVWWDQTLNPGESFDEVTEKALNEAKAVVVLWSKKSVASRWVRSEATQASESKTLVPVMIEPCKRPIMFELTHTSDLSHWKGDANDPAWQAYLAGVKRLVRGEAAGRSTPVLDAHSASPGIRVGKGALAAVIATVLLAGTAGFWLLNRQRNGAANQATGTAAVSAGETTNTLATTAKPSVAVLPFANLTGDASKDFIGEGMAEELINALTTVPGLMVTSRTSSFAYKGRDTDLRKIAQALNVSTILEGSVRSAGETIRITAQLIDAQSDRHFWSKTYDYDRNHTDLFKMQDNLAREIVTAFKTTMGADLPELQAQAPPTTDPEAYSLYLQALASANRISDASLRKAVELLEAAVTRDPKFARAYLVLAQLHEGIGSPIAVVERYAQKAVALDPSQADRVKLALSITLASRRGDWVAAGDMYRSVGALEKYPDLAGINVLSELWPTGQLQKVLDATAEYYRKNPTEGGSAWQLGVINFTLGHNVEALKYADAAVALGIDASGRRIKQSYADLAWTAGRYAEAANYMVDALPERVRNVGGADTVRLVFAAMGDSSKKPAAIAALQKLLPTLKPEEWVVQVWAMGWFTQLGAIDQSYAVAEQLRKQFADHAPRNAWSWLWSPQLRMFRQDRRFQSFATRLGLMAYWQKYGPPDVCDLNDGTLTCR